MPALSFPVPGFGNKPEHFDRLLARPTTTTCPKVGPHSSSNRGNTGERGQHVCMRSDFNSKPTARHHQAGSTRHNRQTQLNVNQCNARASPLGTIKVFPRSSQQTVTVKYRGCNCHRFHRFPVKPLRTSGPRGWLSPFLYGPFWGHSEQYRGSLGALGF